MEIVGVRNDIEPQVSGRRTEEHPLDANSEVFDTILMGEAIETARSKLEERKNRGIDTCSVFKSFFHFFSVNPTPLCPDFVKWCADNFSVTKGVIMDKSQSQILCHVRSPAVCKTLGVPNEFTCQTQDYREEDNSCYFRESPAKSKEAFLQACSKSDSEPINLSYPIDLGQFNEET